MRGIDRLRKVEGEDLTSSFDCRGSKGVPGRPSQDAHKLNMAVYITAIVAGGQGKYGI